MCVCVCVCVYAVGWLVGWFYGVSTQYSWCILQHQLAGQISICIFMYTCLYIYICTYVSSSSSCRAGSTDIPDPLSSLLPIVHCPR